MVVGVCLTVKSGVAAQFAAQFTAQFTAQWVSLLALPEWQCA